MDTLLHTLLTCSERSLFRLLQYKFKNENYITDWQNYFIVIGKKPITLVSHLDTVCKEVPNKLTYWFDKNQNSMMVKNAENFALGADDRAGVWTLLNVWDSLSENDRPTLAFFNQEEIGCIGVRNFLKSKHVNILQNEHFFIEFDRRGYDNCVFYETKNMEFQTMILDKFELDKEYGSTSDIKQLTAHYRISSVNMSIGYKSEHSASETLRIDTMAFRMRQTVKFMREYTNGKQYKEVDQPVTYSTYDYQGWGAKKPSNYVTLKDGAEFSFDKVNRTWSTVKHCPDCDDVFELVGNNWTCKCTYYPHSQQGMRNVLDFLNTSVSKKPTSKKWTCVTCGEHEMQLVRVSKKNTYVCKSCKLTLYMTEQELKAHLDFHLKKDLCPSCNAHEASSMESYGYPTEYWCHNCDYAWTEQPKNTYEASNKVCLDCGSNLWKVGNHYVCSGQSCTESYGSDEEYDEQKQKLLV